MGFLVALIRLLFPPRKTELIVETAEMLPISPVSIPGEHGAVTALMSYRHATVRAFIVEAKYHGNPRAFRLLGEALADYLLELYADISAFGRRDVVLIPMPLSKEREGERGYNQVVEVLTVAQEMLGESVSLEDETLFRVKHTKPQTTLSGRERRENVRGAFRAKRINPTRTYILVDDVLTTGATMEEAHTTLMRLGATSVIAIALAH